MKITICNNRNKLYPIDFKSLVQPRLNNTKSVMGNYYIKVPKKLENSDYYCTFFNYDYNMVKNVTCHSGFVLLYDKGIENLYISHYGSFIKDQNIINGTHPDFIPLMLNRLNDNGRFASFPETDETNQAYWPQMYGIRKKEDGSYEHYPDYYMNYYYEPNNNNFSYVLIENDDLRTQHIPSRFTLLDRATGENLLNGKFYTNVHLTFLENIVELTKEGITSIYDIDKKSIIANNIIKSYKIFTCWGGITICEYSKDGYIYLFCQGKLSYKSKNKVSVSQNEKWSPKVNGADKITIKVLDTNEIITINGNINAMKTFNKFFEKI